MDFWRSGQARTYRDPALPRKGMSLWKRITSLYFPPWVPVAGIMVAVFGILGLLIYARQASGAPRINDHWHAAYAIFIGDQRQPHIPTFTGPEEVHTHGDGVIHMHPFIPAGEGSGAAVGKFFQYGSGKLSSDELNIPGQRETYKNGDLVPGTETPGVVRILRADSGIHPLGIGSQAIPPCDAKLESEFETVNSRYIPKDGDCIRIIFGPPGVQVVVEADRTVISPDDATRTVELSVTGSGDATAFSPATLEVQANEIVKVVLSNDSEPELVNGQPTGLPFHGVRFSGTDKLYGTSDDFVVEPATLHPGETGTAVIRFETAGEFEFRDEAATEGVTPATGKITVTAVTTATPTPTPGPEEVDVTLDVAMSDNFFEPKELTVEAGKKFRITLSNGGESIHNLRIEGADGVYGTARDPGDDLVSDDLLGGATGELVEQIDKPGTYQFRCDFHRTEHTGKLVVQ
jgi:plastocyanin